MGDDNEPGFGKGLDNKKKIEGVWAQWL